MIPLVDVRDLGKTFDVSPPWLTRVLERRPRRQLQAVRAVSFSIERGTTFGLVGESGCGKSTVARLLVGLHRPSTGVIRFDGRDLAAPGSRLEAQALHRRVQMIFQDPQGSLNPRWRVRQIVGEPLQEHRLARNAGELRERVLALLEQVGLASADLDKFSHQFSGGQRQRISIARALATAPDFLVCDEPTSSLDVSVQAQVLNLMTDLQRSRGLTYLFISHNLAVVRHLSDRVGVMYLGRLVEVADKRTLFARPRHPYTQMLIESIPDVSQTNRVHRPVQGEAADPMNRPRGCSFHPRCPHANQRCREQEPELLGDHGSSVACHAVQEGRL